MSYVLNTFLSCVQSSLESQRVAWLWAFLHHTSTIWLAASQLICINNKRRTAEWIGRASAVWCQLNKKKTFYPPVTSLLKNIATNFANSSVSGACGERVTFEKGQVISVQLACDPQSSIIQIYRNRSESVRDPVFFIKQIFDDVLFIKGLR